MNMNKNYNPYMMNNPNVIANNNQVYNPNMMSNQDYSYDNQSLNQKNNSSTKTNINQIPTNNNNEEVSKENKKHIITNSSNQQAQQKDNKKNAKKEAFPKDKVKKEEGKKEDKKDKKEKEIEKEKDYTEEKDMELIVDSKEGKMIEVDESLQPVSIVFIGHVDHGKSTIAGNILISSGMVDDRTIEKYQKEAKSKGRDSWYIAYCMDFNEDEREKGKTIEIGKAFFKTKTKRFTILDAPGHSGYLPNMLLGACQADFAGLVISAKGGEFEAGFEKSGSTREHILLAKSLGVNKLVVLVNKMDEESVKWSETRFNQIRNDLSEYLKKVGYNVEKDIHFVPLSGLYGDNLKEPLNKKKCPWYEGSTVLELLDSLEQPKRETNAPLRISILDRYKEGGMHVMGKVESGVVKYGSSYTLMPLKQSIDIQWIFNSEDEGVPYALPGESVRLKIKGIENELDINRGYIICSQENLCGSFDQVIAEIIVLELPETKKIMATGYTCIMHYHTTVAECTLTIMAEIDKKTKEEMKVKFVKNNTRAKVLIKANSVLCGEKFESYPTLGRFTLRDEGKTIAVGKVLKYKLGK
eukprot:CAMPEP_0170515672 /NCGR_PEP_ID=MMETSP0209-20121228/2069_1 /TAXON_ID=665100 ORGANISM="Litonotus pictus, Strain P1" /NCGR_SAMPLE_ID=MMETSP0209 /ASSEMBLY_ACC=CAM_ASM_000301 /LENGTH=580 /DNA_ID=CAMNT_0010800265 /DNA_START=183 /DNA_END=1925 /DNA_ORIENTATION=+